MFVSTYGYMLIWVYTGEVNAKRVRENYLKAVLRQEIAYIDKVGAGEVTTRIQSDTRTSFPHSPLSIAELCGRSDSTRHIGESCNYC